MTHSIVELIDNQQPKFRAVQPESSALEIRSGLEQTPNFSCTNSYLEPLGSIKDSGGTLVPPLLGSSATSLHFESIEGYEEATQVINADPLLKELRKQNFPWNGLNSMVKCKNKYISGEILLKCACSTQFIQLRHHCNLRTCPDCAKIRKNRLRKRMLPILEKYNTNPRKCDFLYFLTISPQNYTDLEHGLKDINKNFAKFMRIKYIKERLLGSLKVIETTNNGKGWHIHIHAIVYGRWLDNKVRVEGQDSKIVSIWKKISHKNVNIHIQRQNSSEYTLNYLLKYISINKEEFPSVEDLAKYIVVTRNQRLISTNGLFFKVKFPKVSCSCPACGEKLKIITDFIEVQSYKMNLPEFNPPT